MKVAMVDSFMELTGFSNLDYMKQRHLMGVFGVVRLAVIVKTGDCMLPWEQVCSQKPLRTQWKAPGVTDRIEELCLLPPNNPNVTKVIERKRYAVFISCDFSNRWADLVSVYITKNATSLKKTIKNTLS